MVHMIRLIRIQKTSQLLHSQLSVKECESELKQLKRIPPETIANIVENKKKLDLARAECR